MLPLASKSPLRWILWTAVLLTTLAVGGAGATAQDSPGQDSPAQDSPARRPNVVLILADDLGFSDLGCYGSEIATPHLDRLANEGLRFRRFHNTGRCCPSRASLLTGLWSHQAGVGHMLGATDLPAYRDGLTPACTTLAELLGSSGYRTLMAGKWHVGWRDEQSPPSRGFDRFYGTRGYVDSYYTVVPRTEVELDRTQVLGVTEEPVNHLHPDREWYTTDAYTDYALHFLDEAESLDRPWFLYLAYNAPHFPLHARPEDLARYRGRYREGGWDAARANRYRRMVELGLVDPETCALSPRDAPAWDELDEAARDELDLKMALFAAIVDRLDQNVGRVLDWLEDHDALDDTLVVFLSDNGGTKETGLHGIGGREVTPDNYESWARKGGWSSSYGRGWANLSNTPYRQYKRSNHHGGTAAPLIVRWPGGGVAEGSWTDQVAHIVDLWPTLAELAGAEAPTERRGRRVPAPAGRSLVPVLAGEELGPRTLFWEHEGHRAVQHGDWKLVGLRGEDWELYDLAKDRSELRDLAATETALRDALRTRWEDWADAVGARPWPEVQAARKAFRERSERR